MAQVTLERLAEGIRRANAAGDVETVRKLGAAYRQLQGQGGDVVTLQGKVTPQGSSGEQSTNVQGLDAQGSYDFALGRVRDKYFPKATEEQWAEVADRYKPYNSGDLLNAGLTFGFNDEAAGAGNAVADFFRGLDAGESYHDFTALERARQELGAEQQGALGVAAEAGGAILAGRPDMAATRVAGLVPTMVEGAKAGIPAGAIYGFGSSDGDIGERAHDAAQGALVGAGVGAVIPAAVSGARKVISPFSASPSKTRAADILASEGVELSAGQRVGSKGLQYRESELGGAAAQGLAERQADQFTSAALRRAGINANRATPDVIDAGFDAIGQQFDDLASRNGIGQDRALLNDISAIWRDYSGVVSQSNRAPVVENMIRDIVTEFQKGAISGSFYQSIRSRIDRLARGTRDSDLAMTLRDLKGALDDAMERSIAQFNPGDLGAWQEARRLYRNILVVEDAVGRAGEAAADGIITPGNLKSAAMRKGKRAFIRGQSEFTDLANAGVSTMTPLPNSGTPGRLGAKIFVPAGAATGAALGHAVLPGVGAIPGAAFGAAVPWLSGRAMLSGVGRRYLGNQLAAGPTPGQAAIVGALLGRGAQPLLPHS